MSEDELRQTNWRRRYEADLRNEFERNADAIESIRQDLQRIYRDIAEIKGEQQRVAAVSAELAAKHVLGLFGLSPEDQRAIEEQRATVRFATMMHGLFQRGLLIGVTTAVTIAIGVVAVKMGWTSK